MPDEIVYVDDYIPVPGIFYREKTNKPFNECTVCGKELIENREIYLIEKAFRQDLKTRKRELIFEFAYCYNCMEAYREQFSEESKRRINEYFEKNANLRKRNKKLLKLKLFDIDIWLNNCIVKNKAIDEVEEFQIYAQCEGGDMVFYYAPYMICGEAMDEVAQLLSNKTLDIINGFWADNIDLPPEIEDIFKTKRPILF